MPELELEDKLIRESHSIFNSFYFTYELDLRFNLEKVIDLFIFPIRDCPLFKNFISSLKKIVCTPFGYQPQLITLLIT